MPKVSIIIPIYNADEYLKNCLDSIIKQSLEDIEIICINDGSTDSSAKILEEYSNHSNIKVINQENSGVSIARNRGIEEANGEYIGFVDSDDWVDIDFYEKLYDSAKRHNAEIAAAGFFKVKSNSKKPRTVYTEEELFSDIQEKINICNIPKYCYVWNKIYKLSELKKNNLKFTENVNYEDVRFTIRALYYLERLVTVPDVFYYYRSRKNSIVKTTKNTEDKANALIDMFNFADEHKIIFPDKARIFTVKKLTCLNILFMKIKRTKNSLIYLLFGIIPIFKTRLHKN